MALGEMARMEQAAVQQLANGQDDEVINYLLAWRWWREDVKEWHSLKEENLTLYTNASKDIGNIPAVLYSVVKVLNSIGTNFADEGIN